MKNKTFVEQLKKFEGRWVALLEPDKKVVASGGDASETKQRAEKEGYKSFILLKVLPFRTGYVPCL